MASSTFIAFLLLTSLAVQIHARDSQFFSKVTGNPTDAVVLPDKQAEQRSLVNKREPEQQPEFVPQNQDVYGLYGHETGLFPPETETKTEVAGGSFGGEKYYNNDKNGGFNDQFENINGETFYANNGEKLDTSSETQKDDLLNFDDAFDEAKGNSGETFYSNNGAGTERYTTDNVGESYDDNTDRSGRFGSQLGQTETYYNDNRFDKGFADELNARYNEYRASQNRGASSVERKGMSDTRFVENGKYYYDLNKEQKQYAARNTYNPNNEFGNRAYENNEVVGTTGNRNYNDDVYDNSGGEKYEFYTMEEYEKSRLNRYDP